MVVELQCLFPAGQIDKLLHEPGAGGSYVIDRGGIKITSRVNSVRLLVAGPIALKDTLLNIQVMARGSEYAD